MEDSASDWWRHCKISKHLLNASIPKLETPFENYKPCLRNNDDELGSRTDLPSHGVCVAHKLSGVPLDPGYNSTIVAYELGAKHILCEKNSAMQLRA